MAQLQVTVVTRSEELYAGPASMVSAPSKEGSLGILPGRQPILAAMVPGTVTIKAVDEGTEKTFSVGAGFISVDSDQVTIVVDSR